MPASEAQVTGGPIRIRFALAPVLRRASGWSQDIGRAVIEANGLLQPHLGRRIQVADVVPWPEGGRARTLEEAYATLTRSVPRGDADIVVGLTAAMTYLREASGGGTSVGMARYEDGYALLAIQQTVPRIARLLAHEVAHLFGAVHLTVDGGLMSHASGGANVDSINAALIRLNRDRRFGGTAFPLPPERLDEARELYERALDDGGAEPLEVRLLLARLDVESGRADDAIRFLEPIALEGPGSDEAEVLLAIAYRRANRYEDALARYDEMLGRRPQAFRLHFNRGVALRAMGRLQEAIVAYRTAADIAPHFIPAHNNLSEAYAALGRAADALAAARRALELGPNDPVALANLGYALYLSGSLDEGQRLSEQVLARDPDSPVAHNTLGKVHEARGMAFEAEAEFRSAVAADPSYFRGWLNLAQLLSRKEDTEEALTAARRALDLRSRSAAAHAVMGRALLGVGRWGDAAAEMEGALAIDPGMDDLLGELGYAYLELGDLERSRDATRRALDIDPSVPWAWANLGVIAAREGDLETAERHYRRALEYDPTYAAAWANLGHALIGQERFEEAGPAYERAVALGVRTGVVYNNLALVRYRAGDVESAFRYAERAIAAGYRMHPEFVQALEGATGRRLPGGGHGDPAAIGSRPPPGADADGPLMVARGWRPSCVIPPADGAASPFNSLAA